MSPIIIAYRAYTAATYAHKDAETGADPSVMLDAARYYAEKLKAFPDLTSVLHTVEKLIETAPNHQ